MEQNNLSTLETFYRYIEEVFVLSGIGGFLAAILNYIRDDWQRGGLIAGFSCDFCSPLGTGRLISPTVENQDKLKVTEIVSRYLNPRESVIAMLIRRTVTKEIDGFSLVLGFLAAVVLAIAYLLVKKAIQKLGDKIKGKARDFINSCIMSHRVNVLSQYAVEKGGQRDL